MGDRRGALHSYIEHFGHTSFSISRGALCILIDPIFVRQDLDFRRPACPRWLTEDLAKFDAIFLSHGHNDHLHPPSLLGFPTDVAIYFLDEAAEGCSCDQHPREFLTALGFRNLHPFRPGDVIALAEGVQVHVLPARRSVEGEEQCCFLIETPEVRVFNAVDIQDTPVTRQALEPYRERIDIAFVPTGASVQWQGFWNQMDAVEALAFCEWLQPARVATCGGAVSLSARPRLGTLERYPEEFADWLAMASTRLRPEQLVAQRPPYRLAYEAHRLLRCGPIHPASRFNPGTGARPPSALVTTVFTGYHPSLPTKRCLWPDEDLAHWLGTLDSVREVARNALGDFRYLLKRCAPSINQSPAGLLAPRTLRCLNEAGALDEAARLTSLIPPAPTEPEDLDVSFFSVVDGILGGISGPAEAQLTRLRTCLWLDRGMFHLRVIFLRLRKLAHFEEGAAEALRSEHLASLARTVDRRRPVLGANHLRVRREQVHLLDGRPPAPETAEVLCYASPTGVYQRVLSPVETLLLDCCDGRSFAEIVSDVSTALAMPGPEVHAALFTFLSELGRNSAHLIDWSR
ncbi:MBL fold metallo-hydrolase [Archangium violaceum]|uniref:MBL fold metallo-hydrolase n=1 Tax=Archangium violaceum TaxID=83451 RepID=UPI002B2AF954|nr:MBL fold metallo-hydrolase [Archangium gephyra]